MKAVALGPGQDHPAGRALRGLRSNWPWPLRCRSASRWQRSWRLQAAFSSGARAFPTIRASQGGRADRRAVGVRHARVTISSELPPGGGLGSSAAFAVALARTLAALTERSCGFDRLSEIGAQSERLFHGHPSGVDHTVSAREGLIRFWKGPPPRVESVVARRPLADRRRH